MHSSYADNRYRNENTPRCKKAAKSYTVKGLVEKDMKLKWAAKASCF